MRQKKESKMQKASDKTENTERMRKTALDGIAERVQFIKQALREILEIAEKNDVEVTGIIEDLTHDQRARLKLGVSEHDQRVIDDYWDSSTAKCNERAEYYRRRGEKDPYEEEDNS